MSATRSRRRRAACRARRRARPRSCAPDRAAARSARSTASRRARTDRCARRAPSDARTSGAMNAGVPTICAPPDAHRRHRAEVDQLGATVARAAHVARADVAVQQPARVQQRERRAHVEQQRARFAPRQRRALAQVAAVEQLHRVVRRPAVVQPVVVDLDHARMAAAGPACETRARTARPAGHCPRP